MKSDAIVHAKTFLYNIRGNYPLTCVRLILFCRSDLSEITHSKHTPVHLGVGCILVQEPYRLMAYDQSIPCNVDYILLYINE